MSAKFNSKKRRSNFKGRKDADLKSKVDKVKEECANDPSWYTVNGQLTKDVASLSFNNPAGISYALNTDSDGSFVSPGIMSIYMAPVPGYSAGLSSPINIAAKNIYSWVRHANSGHSNYDSPDLMLMIIAMANAYSYYAWMTRLYGMIRVYSQHNRYLGRNMLIACGVDPDLIAIDLANFRAYINQYALKLSALSVPSTMSLFKRYMWMFSNVYKDEDTSKAQIYMYNPAYLYKYDEYNGAGRLVPEPLCLNATGVPGYGRDLGSLQVYGDTLIGALIGSEDVNIMSGDILKAYGSENIWKLALIPEEYAIVPIFSEEVLSQIHNTVFFGNKPLDADHTTPGWGSFVVEQDTNIGQGCLICKPLNERGGNIESAHILDFWKEDVEPDDIMVATRNMIGGSRWSQGYTEAWTFGTEIPLWARISNLKADGTLMAYDHYAQDSKTALDATYTSYSAAAAHLSKVHAFNEHPYLYVCKYNNTSPYATIDASASDGEMSNFTILENIDLEKMHLSAILSEFAVPLLGNIAK